MALQKTLEYDTGVSGDYWQLYQVRFDRAGMQMSIEFRHFLSATAATEGKQPIGSMTIWTTFTAQEITTVDAVTLAYQKAKAAEDSFFADAVDV
jgi:hypothetical protein